MGAFNKTCVCLVGETSPGASLSFAKKSFWSELIGMLKSSVIAESSVIRFLIINNYIIFVVLQGKVKNFI